MDDDVDMDGGDKSDEVNFVSDDDEPSEVSDFDEDSEPGRSYYHRWYTDSRNQVKGCQDHS
jgi:hypothetical protein